MDKMDNNQMRIASHHVLYVCDNASSHQVKEYSHIKFLMLPANATSILQPLDQGIMMSTKRRYKVKLAERYLVCVLKTTKMQMPYSSLWILWLQQTWLPRCGGKPLLQLSRIAFAKQASNTTQWIPILNQRSLQLPKL